MVFTKKYSLKNKRVFISGGTKGIGLAIAVELLKYNVQAIAVCSSSKKNVHEAVAVLKNVNTDVILINGYTCDVTHETKIYRIVSKFQPDVLITSAGINSCQYFEQLTNADFLRQIQVDTLGVLNCVRGALSYMKKKGGVVVNISSLLSTTPMIGYSAFCAGKGAIQLALEAIQNEYAKDDIFIQHVLAPAVKTDMLTEEDTINELTHLFGEGETHDCLPEEFSPYVIKGIISKNKYITFKKDILYRAINLFFNCNNAPKDVFQFIKNSILLVPVYWVICIKKSWVNNVVRKNRY